MKIKAFKTICIVGSGYMGAQIGLHCAVHGFSVMLLDNREDALKRASESHSNELKKRLEKGHITGDEMEDIISRVKFTGDIAEGASGAELVLEAVPERLEIKREVFSQLDDICPGDTILATNSSAIPISKIEGATKRLDKVLNMHFYSPVWERPMVELMCGTGTSDETINRSKMFTRAIGMTPLIVRKESIGFIFNRVWRAIKRECLHLVDEGVASYEDVDRAFMIAMGSSMGPFGRMDRVGLDVVRDIEIVYYNESCEDRDAPPRVLLNKIEKGDLGIKTGKGFYTYPDPAFQSNGWLKSSED